MRGGQFFLFARICSWWINLAVIPLIHCEISFRRYFNYSILVFHNEPRRIYVSTQTFIFLLSFFFLSELPIVLSYVSFVFALSRIKTPELFLGRLWLHSPSSTPCMGCIFSSQIFIFTERIFCKPSNWN